MFSKVFVTLLATSSAIVSVTARYYRDDVRFKDDVRIKYEDDKYYGRGDSRYRDDVRIKYEDDKYYGRDGGYYRDDVAYEYEDDEYYGRDDGYYRDDVVYKDEDDEYYGDAGYYRDGGYYRDDYYRAPEVFEEEVIIDGFVPRERVEHYGPYVEVLEKEVAFKSKKYPEVFYPKTAQKEELSEGHLEVKYFEKHPPKPQGAIIFPSEYAKYETKSDGPHVPLFKGRKIYADVFEKQFVCPKFEKVVYVTIPGKCTCEPINVHPKIIKAPKLIHDDHFGYDDEVITKEEFKEVKIEDDRRWW